MVHSLGPIRFLMGKQYPWYHFFSGIDITVTVNFLLHFVNRYVPSALCNHKIYFIHTHSAGEKGSISMYLRWKIRRGRKVRYTVVLSGIYNVLIFIRCMASMWPCFSLYGWYSYILWFSIYDKPSITVVTAPNVATVILSRICAFMT